jgi:DNA-binding transcriptional MerR regulator
MSEYKSSDVQNLFGISYETVRRWADEFKPFLSEGANPGSGKHRVFDDNDLRVLSLVSSMKSGDMSLDEIHLALKAGQRGDIPSMLDERALEIGVNLQLTIARQQVRDLQNQLSDVMEEAQQWRDKAKTLEGKLEAVQEQMLHSQQGQSSVIELYLEIARLKLLLEMERAKDKPAGGVEKSE